ncbi:hypothetical protein SAMN04490208_0934 [Pseudomonas poae]|uniref:Type VI secretion protein n=2 Tax=Pseudomonas poae TaxID=200451 RepID=A0ABY0RCK6_9PSED|nr:hypothetical protein SAMN04490208_0934 [Pseudomonas poae]
MLTTFFSYFRRPFYSGRAASLSGRYLMLDRPWQVLVLALCLLSGCNANYVFDDADYRPLGDPQAGTRGQQREV